VTVKVWPWTLTVPVRAEVVVLAATVTVTVPLPLLVLLEAVIQLRSELAAHEQALPAATVKTALPPPAGTLAEADDRV
jgi:hypothetical protein